MQYTARKQPNACVSFFPRSIPPFHGSKYPIYRLTAGLHTPSFIIYSFPATKITGLKAAYCAPSCPVSLFSESSLSRSAYQMHNSVSRWFLKIMQSYKKCYTVFVKMPILHFWPRPHFTDAAASAIIERFR